MDDKNLAELFARRLRSEMNLGDGVTFAVKIDDPEPPTYMVESKAFVDADRAGYSGYRHTPLFRDLSSGDADQIAAMLNEAGRIPAAVGRYD